MDKYVHFYVYGDEDDDPYIIKNPPANLRELIAEWIALDDIFMEADGNEESVPEWEPVDLWLIEKGVELISAEEEILMDDCRKDDDTD
jgi:hypothetical protein